jgi:hypothetical protein
MNQRMNGKRKFSRYLESRLFLTIHLGMYKDMKGEFGEESTEV